MGIGMPTSQSKIPRMAVTPLSLKNADHRELFPGTNAAEKR